MFKGDHRSKLCNELLISISSSWWTAGRVIRECMFVSSQFDV